MTGPQTVALKDVATIERKILEPSAIVTGLCTSALKTYRQVAISLVCVRFRVVTLRVASSRLRHDMSCMANSGLIWRKFHGRSSPAFAARIFFLCCLGLIDRDYLAHFLLRPQSVAWANSRATGANLPSAQSRLFESQNPPPSISRAAADRGDSGCGGGVAGEAAPIPRQTRHPHPVHFSRPVRRSGEEHKALG